MSKVLYIKANAKPTTESRTYKISDSFIEEYKKQHPSDEIITLDLYQEDINFLSDEGIKIHNPSPNEGKDHPILKYAYQFALADKYVFAEPLWNLGIPSILKAYLDYVCITGITFKYTETGVVGLCQGKKAINITSRGGDYSSEPFSSFEMGDRYLRAILGFLGVVDFTTIAADNMDVVGVDVNQILDNAINQAKEKAKTF